MLLMLSPRLPLLFRTFSRRAKKNAFADYPLWNLMLSILLRTDNRHIEHT
jgi:hypothetical protein